LGMCGRLRRPHIPKFGHFPAKYGRAGFWRWRYRTGLIGKNKKRIMKKRLYPFSAALLVSAYILMSGCGEIGTGSALPAETPTPNGLAMNTAQEEPVVIRWGIGIGDGTDPAQVSIENAVARDFNASQRGIHLVLEIVPKNLAHETLLTEIAAGVGPDIVGPVNWFEANTFHDQWLDLTPLLTKGSYDTSKFEPAMLKSYQDGQATIAIPFAVDPSAIFYNTSLFSEAGLNPLPARYGDQYKMPDGSMVDWTWDTLTRLAKLLTLDSAGKHSGEAGFDATKIRQYGFSFGWESHPNYWGTFMINGGALLVPGGSEGNYRARVPEAWKAAWQWVYDGMYSAEPYIPNGVVAETAAFGHGNVFASGKVGMLENPASYLCCAGELVKAGGKFDLGSMPEGEDGTVAGRVDEATFRIWAGSKHPAEAFTVLRYLVDTGVHKLVAGSHLTAPAYAAVPASMAERVDWLAAQQASYPFVKNWDTLLAGLNYPDVPSAEAYMPNMDEAWVRIQTFGDLLVKTSGVDLAAQESALESDLTKIFNK
jgi:multiple sugar transport system substrate-binding protein